MLACEMTSAIFVSHFRGEMEMYKQKAKDDEIKGYEDFEGIEEEWEDFNQSKTKSKSK